VSGKLMPALLAMEISDMAAIAPLQGSF
jgi:hypothetical protein